MNRVVKYLIGVLIVLVGVGIVSYPFVSNWWNEMHTSGLMQTYDSVVAKLNTEDLSEFKKQAEEYNKKLADKSDQYRMDDAEKREYFETLDVTGTGVMGYITIPKLDVELPIYHGTTDTVLQIAVGHMDGSSLPIGGENTHSVLSGHTGLPSAKLFTHLDDMVIGDVFYITVLGEVLVYRVESIDVVLPDKTDSLFIEDGKDIVTLVTCTPYGQNTHRLLVRGERVDTMQNKVTLQSDSLYLDARAKLLLALSVFGVLFIISIVGLIVMLKRRSDM